MVKAPDFDRGRAVPFTPPDRKGERHSNANGDHSFNAVAESPSELLEQKEELRRDKQPYDELLSRHEELRRSESMLRDFVESASVALHSVGPDGRILWANRAELELLGYSQEEYIGRHITEFHVDTPVIQDILERLVSGQALREREARLRCKDGSIRHVLIDSNAHFEDGKFTHTRCFTRDVTVQKKASTRLAMQQAITKVLADGDGLLEAGPKLIQAVCQSAGWDVGALWTVEESGEKLRCGLVLSCAERSFPKFQRVTQEVRFCRGTGLPGRVWAEGKPVSVADVTLDDNFARRVAAEEEGLRGAFAFPITVGGRVLGVMEFFSREARELEQSLVELLTGFGSQIGQFAERKRAEETLRRSEEQFRQLVAVMPAAVYRCEAPSGAITFYNDHAAKLWGRAPQLGDTEQRFCGAMRLWLPDGRPLPHEKTPVAIALKHGTSFRNQDVVIERPDGSRVNVLVNIDPIRDERGNVTGAINVFHDTTALKQAEVALRENERRFREMIDALPAAVYTTDAQGRLTHFNGAAVEFSGRTPELGTDQWCVSWKLYHADGTPMAHDQCPMAIALKEGRIIRGAEAIAERPDGKRIWFTPYPTPLRDVDGRIVGGINMLVDITERKRAEAVMRIQKEAFEMAASGAASMDVLGFLVKASEGQCEGRAIMGIHLLDESGMRFERTIAPGLPASYAQAVNGMEISSVTGPCCAAILRGQRVIVPDINDCREFPAFAALAKPLGLRSAWSSPILASTGKILGTFVAYYRTADGEAAGDDFMGEVVARTASVIIEGAQAAEVKERLAAIVESSEDAIISKDLNGVIKSWNRGAEQMFGYSAREVIGKHISVLIPAERLDEQSRIIERLKRGERIESFETVRKSKDGGMLDMSLTISPLHDAGGQIIGASKIGRDITERKKAERELSEARQHLQRHAEELEYIVARRTSALQAANEQLEAFVYSIAHDLRAPLRTMIAYSQLLVDDHAAEINDVAQRMLKRIQASAQFMDRLLVDLLAYGRTARAELELDRVEVDKAWEAALLQNAVESERTNARIQTVAPLPAVRAHEATLQQVLVNLLGNALKFVREGVEPEIRFYAEERGGNIRLWVTDNGVGIPSEQQERIFRVFERMHGSRYPGTGIGLSIVRKGVERMGGNVGVESQCGKGSRFWIELPKAD